ncbi:hypothetical protein [Methylobacterium sp. Leaf361]|uniref:hypothetical protein n=1 Tax=Methylobacterium sp. Leaf361 TaxID=1736352 RepID=UPI000ADDB2F2|nr:hypothetical protein [Methylobacterium sp. Leaf361]
MRASTFVFAFFAIAAAGHAEAAGCGGSPQAAPEIAGNYVDNFGGLQAVSNRFWISGNSVFEICSVDGSARNMIAYNHPANSYNPGKFSRFEWVRADNRLWYCQAVYDASTEGAAMQAPPADPANPAQSGCGTFPWSTLIRILP